MFTSGMTLKHNLDQNISFLRQCRLQKYDDDKKENTARLPCLYQNRFNQNSGIFRTRRDFKKILKNGI